MDISVKWRQCMSVGVSVNGVYDMRKIKSDLRLSFIVYIKSQKVLNKVIVDGRHSMVSML